MNNTDIRTKALEWWESLTKLEKATFCYKEEVVRPCTGGEIETIYRKEHGIEDEVKYKESNSTGLSESLDKYIKEKHTQEECVGFIDGFKEAKEKDKAIIQELLDGLKKMCDWHENQATWDKGDNGYYQSKQSITKAEQYLK